MQLSLIKINAELPIVERFNCVVEKFVIAVQIIAGVDFLMNIATTAIAITPQGFTVTLIAPSPAATAVATQA